jgi:protein TonB
MVAEPPETAKVPPAAGLPETAEVSEVAGLHETAKVSEAAAEPPDHAKARPSTPIQPGDFVEAGDVDERPVPRSRTQPDYPAIARRLGQSGTVVLEVLVDERGRVAEVAPLDPSARGEFLSAATRAVRSWTYAPATKSGVPVKTRITVRIDFKLQPGSPR